MSLSSSSSSFSTILPSNNRQASNSVVMIRPVGFRMNEQTAVNNYYQKGDVRVSPENVNALAQGEFDGLVAMLRNIGVVVIVVEDTTTNDTPDSIFPNNWVSFHDIEEGRGSEPGTGGCRGGVVVLYPMFAENRRLERRPEILDMLRENHNFRVSEMIDMSPFEMEGRFLEGTGSIIFDRTSRKAYCALSPRADRVLLLELCGKIGFTAVIFDAFQTVSVSDVSLASTSRKHIYHTNVMMCIAYNFAVICPDAIDNSTERQAVLDSLAADGKSIIKITEDQVNHFAGNMLEVKGSGDKRYLVMSKTAYECLQADQVNMIESLGCEIKYSDISLIECLGGGSVRCMLLEVFLPKN